MARPEVNRLIDSAKVHLPGALDGAINLELFGVLHEFFQASNCWYEDIQFAVVPTEATRISDIASFTYDIAPTMGTITRLIGVFDADGSGVGAVMDIPGCVILNQTPPGAQTYTARVLLTVVDPASPDGIPMFPLWVLQKYFSGILDGLVGRMMAQPAKPYTSMGMAGPRLRKFKAVISQAKVEANHGNVYASKNWRFPRFGV